MTARPKTTNPPKTAEDDAAHPLELEFDLDSYIRDVFALNTLRTAARIPPGQTCEPLHASREANNVDSVRYATTFPKAEKVFA